MAKLCECGCNQEVKTDKHRFIHGHNRKGKIISENTKKKQSLSKIRFYANGGKFWNTGLTKETDKRVLKNAVSTSKSRLDKFKKDELTIWNKGLTENIDERVLKNCVKGGKTRRKKFKSGELKIWNKGLTKKTDKRIEKLGFQIGDKHINKKPENRKKLRLGQIKRVEKQIANGLPLIPCSGKYEKKAIDFLEQVTGYKFKRQYRIDGYFLDGYCSILKLAIEIDEKYHDKIIEKDFKRQKYIEEKLGCTFWRIKL